MKSFIFILIISFLGYNNIYSFLSLTGVKIIGSGGDYLTIASAINSLNANGVGSGGVTFNISAGYTETFASTSAGLITATGTALNPIIFKKAGSGNNPIITAPTGIGSNDYILKLSSCDYITWDGIDLKENSSNTTDGKKMEYGIRITNSSATDGAQNNTIKNCSIILEKTNNNNVVGIYQLCETNPTNNTYENSYNIFSNIYIENVKSGIILGGLSADGYFQGCQIKNCTIGLEAADNIRECGIKISYGGNLTISDNIIRNISSIANAYGIYIDSSPIISFTYTNNIFNNKIYNIKSAVNNSSFGIFLSNNSNAGTTINVYNNMISNISCANTTVTPTILLRGIYLFSGSCNYYIYHNTIVINSNEFPSSIPLHLVVGNFYIKNNLIVNTSSYGATSKRFCIYLTGGTIQSSDYNDFYINTSGTNNFVGFYSTAKTTLADWKSSAANLDINSVSTTVTFVNNTDLHLSDASIGNELLAGTPITNFMTDIDGELRNSTKPYLGADENTTTPLPVELSSFNATTNNNSVILNWQTATELNSVKFEIERKTKENNIWKYIGEINSHGTSFKINNYTYNDYNVNTGIYYYRLKHINNNGSYEYSEEILVNMEHPKSFCLYQNYPNPFNPNTNISFTIPITCKVNISLYSINGELVTTFLNTEKEAGYYTINFDVNSINGGLSSGVYFYRITAGSFSDTKKMIILR